MMQKKTRNYPSRAFITIFVMLYFVIMGTNEGWCAATPTKVGNGDEGTDLEGCVPIESGIIVRTRSQAVELLKKLNVVGIIGLGDLLPDVESTKLYLAKQNIKAVLPGDLSLYHSSAAGLVYARTFPRPYAASRFMPVALTLSESQLVSLHVHEGLHRTLPDSVREDENIVSRLTLAITSPDATHDSVRKLATQLIPEDSITQEAPKNDTPKEVSPPEQKLRQYPSRLEVTYLFYFDPRYQVTKQTSPEIDHAIKFGSYIYPFGEGMNAFGLGIDLSLVKLDNEYIMGPLGLSAGARLWTSRGFDLKAFFSTSLSSVADEKYELSTLGRDNYTIGMSLRKQTEHFYFQNTLGYTLPSAAKWRIANTEYEFEYGRIIAAGIKIGKMIDAFDLSAFLEYYQSDSYDISGGEFIETLGRAAIIAWGPDIVFKKDMFQFEVTGRFMLSADEDVDFNRLGDLNGIGIGQGFIGITCMILF